MLSILPQTFLRPFDRPIFAQKVLRPFDLTFLGLKGKILPNFSAKKIQAVRSRFFERMCFEKGGKCCPCFHNFFLRLFDDAHIGDFVLRKWGNAAKFFGIFEAIRSSHFCPKSNCLKIFWPKNLAAFPHFLRTKSPICASSNSLKKKLWKHGQHFPPFSKHIRSKKRDRTA